MLERYEGPHRENLSKSFLLSDTVQSRGKDHRRLTTDPEDSLPVPSECRLSMKQPPTATKRHSGGFVLYLTILSPLGRATERTACSVPTTYGAVTLPGVPPNSSWSGYARVSDAVALFYHLSEATASFDGAETNTRTMNQTAARPPLIIWTNGGPGASSVLYGDWFQNVGAFHVTSSQVSTLPSPGERLKHSASTNLPLQR